MNDREWRKRLGKSRSKLTKAEVSKILALRGAFSQSSLAIMFRVSPATIQKIHEGRMWKKIKRIAAMQK